MSLLDSLIFGVRTWIFGGSELPQRDTVEVTGAGVTVADDSINGRTTITIPGNDADVATLTASLASEASTRAAADTSLQSQIDTNTSTIGLVKRDLSAHAPFSPAFNLVCAGSTIADDSATNASGGATGSGNKGPSWDGVHASVMGGIIQVNNNVLNTTGELTIEFLTVPAGTAMQVFQGVNAGDTFWTVAVASSGSSSWTHTVSGARVTINFAQNVWEWTPTHVAVTRGALNSGGAGLQTVSLYFNGVLVGTTTISNCTASGTPSKVLTNATTQGAWIHIAGYPNARSASDIQTLYKKRMALVS